MNRSRPASPTAIRLAGTFAGRGDWAGAGYSENNTGIGTWIDLAQREATMTLIGEAFIAAVEVR